MEKIVYFRCERCSHATVEHSYVCRACGWDYLNRKETYQSKYEVKQ